MNQIKIHPQSVKQKKSVAGHSLHEISNMSHSIRDPIESLPAQTRDYKSRLHPLKLHSNLPKPKFKLSLDNEERDMVLQNKDMSKDKIWQLLEKKRFNELANDATNLTSDLLS
jgi:hypothetical protein